MAEILPFTSYFPQQTLMGAKMQGEQLKAMKGQRRQQEAQQQAISDIYGTPEEAARQGIMQQEQARKLDMFTKSMDFLDEVYDTHGEEAATAIVSRPEVSQNIAPFIDPTSLSFTRDRKGTTRTRFIPAQDMDGVDKSGKQITIKGKTPVTRVREPDGKEYLVPETMTVEDVAKVQKGQPKPADYNAISRRITTLEGMKAKAKGGDASVIGALYASLGQEVPKGDEKDTKALIARIEHEQKILRKQLPKGYVQEKVAEPVIDESSDAVGAFIGQYGQ